MSEERKKVLAMLAEGKITADEAERLLEKLGEGELNESRGDRRHRHGRGHRRLKYLHFGADALPEGGAAGGGESADSSAAPKYLRVEIQSKDDDHVSVRVPIRLIRTGVKLTTLLPSKTSAKLADRGIDLNQLSKLDGEELVEALRELKVDVDSANGDTVHIFCE